MTKSSEICKLEIEYKEQPYGVCAAKGFFVAAGYAGIRKVARDDLVLLWSDKPAEAAGVLTTNQVKAWCVQNNAERLKAGGVEAILCFAGNANACNGELGAKADLEIARKTQELLEQHGKATRGVLTASTGVIGRKLASEKIINKLPELVAGLAKSNDSAARAIMTTDLVPKSFALQINAAGKTFHVGGIAKGSGMIAPNMATMLAFITTDLEVPARALQTEIERVTDRTFNCISVDGDTSTNDMVLVLANGASDLKWADYKEAFSAALEKVCQELALMVARDGEGATKLVHVTVRGARTESDGKKIARTIADSPLVKTACFGNDPNWGRILAAAGRAGVSFDVKEVSVRLAGVEIFRAGEPTNYVPDDVSAKMKSKDLTIDFEFINGSAHTARMWTCDFSYDYVKINADYGT